MYGEKKSHLYLWMEHYGYDMPANIYKMYSQPSRKTDDANKKVSVSASRTIKLNGSTGLSYPDEIKSASYADPISTKAYTNDSSVYDPGGASSSTTLYELNSLSEVSKEISLSDLSSDYQEEQMNKCKLNQMSKLYDDDERTDIQKSYWNVVKKFVRILVSSVAFRRRRYFSDVLNTLDAVVIGVTVVVAVIYALYDKHFLRDIPRLAVLLRPLRLLILIRILQLAHQKRQLERLTRKLVSGNKRRYKKDGFDLDLTYVTERIIAMSFPSSGRESFYRNPIKEVVRFLDTKHPNHYQVYNLCSERAYDPKHFHYRVRRIMIDDHNVPTLEEMLLFSKEVNNWMAQDPENVVAIHCKGGKGRTGTMVCACLIASEIVLNAKESLYFFGERRTDKSNSSKFQGIETPSQNRYVKYFEKLKINYQLTLPPKKVLVIKRLVVYSIHGRFLTEHYTSSLLS